MPKFLAKVIGAILLLGGVAAVVVHYVVEGDITRSFATLGIAVVLLVGGWALFDWGSGISGRWKG